MSALANAMNRTGLTANGAVTMLSSGNPVVDLFFVAGSARNVSDSDLTNMFAEAFGYDTDMTGRLVQWLRDCRGGAGERRAFEVLFRELINRDENMAVKILFKLPELGRWKDILIAFGTPIENFAIAMIAHGLNIEDRLCAKWMPRKGPVAARIRNQLGLSPKGYRKLLVRLTDVVETKMCANEWEKINFEHVPSVAHARYRKAFVRHGKVYETYVKEVQAGTKSIKAGVVFPHDVLSGLLNIAGWRRGPVALDATTRASIVEQWKALPNFLGDEPRDILPMIDVSASMYSSISQGSNVSAMDVAISLGLYVSERMNGQFKGQYLSFTGTPRLHSPHGDIVDKFHSTSTSDVGYNTNFVGAFETVLRQAKASKLKDSELPSTIMVFSDMEFDHCGGSTNFEAVRAKYREAGYTMPQLVFWNIMGRVGNSPVSSHESGTALVSGYSPSIVKSVLAGEMHPEKVMQRALMNDRYSLEEEDQDL